MRKSPNPKLFLALAIGALMLGGGLTFMAYGNLGNAKANLQKMQAESKDEKALKKTLADSMQSLADSTLKLNHLEAGVQSYAYVPTMLSELEKLGKASGINVTGVRPMPKTAAPKKEGDAEGGKPARRKAYDELDIEVKGRGTYRSVLNFVQELSKFPKIVASRTIELAPRAEPGKTTTELNVTINLRAYIFANSTPDTKTAMAPGGTHEG
jgi:Tfp pilus assembly protein PilO